MTGDAVQAGAPALGLQPASIPLAKPLLKRLGCPDWHAIAEEIVSPVQMPQPKVRASATVVLASTIN